MNFIEEVIQERKIYAEFKELFSKLLMEYSFSSLDFEMKQSSVRLKIKIEDPQAYLGEGNFKIQQLRNIVAMRLNRSVSQVSVVFEKIPFKGLDPHYLAESLRQAFMTSGSYKKKINSIFRQVKMSGGQGCMVQISGKTRGQRAGSQKFFSGNMITAGAQAKDYVKSAIAEAKLPAGVIGIKVKVMLPHDVEGIKGPSKVLADRVIVKEPISNKN